MPENSDKDSEILFAPEEENIAGLEDMEAQATGKKYVVRTSAEPSLWKILVVDDEEDVHTITRMLFEDVKYQNKPVEILDAYSGAEARKILAEDSEIALVFLDVVMESSKAGLEVVRYLRETLGNKATRLILRTGQPGEAPESRIIMAYEIDDYKLKTELTAQKMLTSLIGGLRSYAALRNLEYENQLRREVEYELKTAYETLDKVFEQTVSSLSSTIELRDAYTAGHARHVGKLAQEIARRMGLSEEICKMLKLAGYLHDIGKIKIPLELLSKEGGLLEEDWEMIKQHPVTGYELLQPIDFPWPLARVVLEHHERYNGKGYPGGKQHAELLLESQILAVADVVESMMLARPYRIALGKKLAREEIRKNMGVLYHPEVAKICLEIVNENYEFE
jgi:putative nucleotidyltransferase with HDIG domain